MSRRGRRVAGPGGTAGSRGPVGATRPTGPGAARSTIAPEPQPAYRAHRPLYARVLRLRHLTPSGLLCFVFFEGAVALGLLLGLAELVSWWGVLVLPATVALMVKLNDVVAGSLTRAAMAGRPAPVAAPALERASIRPAVVPEAQRPVGEGPTTRLPGMVHRDGAAPVKRPWAERVEMRQQWLRQSATRRYE